MYVYEKQFSQNYKLHTPGRETSISHHNPAIVKRAFLNMAPFNLIQSTGNERGEIGEPENNLRNGGIFPLVRRALANLTFYQLSWIALWQILLFIVLVQNITNLQKLGMYPRISAFFSKCAILDCVLFIATIWGLCRRMLQGDMVVRFGSH
jgi:hypothetical protein